MTTGSAVLRSFLVPSRRTGLRLVQAAGAAALAVSLAGCYVVPLQAGPGGAPITPPPGVVAVPAAPAVAVLNARLYPANDLANRDGVVQASVTSDLNGHGVLSAVIGGESFSGEATRSAGNSRQGQANASGNRGSYMSCQYQMNSAQLGSGQCRMSNGAVFSMHISG